ncbi:MAG: ribbon-helix-helix protein, CopG family [Opitutales bacterium]
MTSLTMHVPEATKRRLQAEARRQGVSVSALVRERLEIVPATTPSKAKDADTDAQKLSLHERSKDLCGCFDSGVTAARRFRSSRPS